MYHEINEDLARRAKEANSWSAYREGSATAEYRRMVDKAAEIAEQQKRRVDPMHHDRIDALFSSYSRRLADVTNRINEIRTRVPSVFIAGPSNFPVRAKERQNDALDAAMCEYWEIQALLDKIRSVGKGGISSDDPNAVEKLRAKLATLEQLQETMKAVNAYYRRHKTLDGCPHLTPEQAARLVADMSRSWRTSPAPFEPFRLSNNLANIKRIRQRIAELEARAETPAEGWTFDGGCVVVNTEINRLQVIFDDRPDADVRDALKRNGFRWAPSQGAWQRQLTNNALMAARRIAAIAPSGEVA